jgi:hypothetical protein
MSVEVLLHQVMVFWVVTHVALLMDTRVSPEHWYLPFHFQRWEQYVPLRSDDKIPHSHGHKRHTVNAQYCTYSFYCFLMYGSIVALKGASIGTHMIAVVLRVTVTEMLCNVTYVK